MSASSIRAEHVPGNRDRHPFSATTLLVVAALAAVSAGLGFLLDRYAGTAIAAAIAIALGHFAFVTAVVAAARWVERQRS